MNFSREKNGYSVREVDNYISNLKQGYEQTTGEQKIRISDLKRELESTKQELKAYKDKNSDISSALVVAVETAKQIENSSKNVYALEIKRLKNLYSRWDSFLTQLIKTYPAVGEKYDYDKLLKEFSDKIDEIIKQNSVDLTDTTPSEPVGIRKLISKMGGLTTRRPENVSPSFVIKRKKPVQDIYEQTSKEQQDLDASNENFESAKNPNLELKIKPIANIDSTEKDKFDSLVEKFFNSPDEDENAYSKALIRQKKSASGFDLKEALNPTEDLAEIMKDFDFFDDDKKKK